MFVLLPLLVFVSLFFHLLGRKQNIEQGFFDWREAFLHACVIWGALVVIFSEVLSLINELSTSGLAVLWGLALLVNLIQGWRGGTFKRTWLKMKHWPWRTPNWMEGLVLVALIAVVGLLFVIAWKVVPNTTDSLLYHMSRVMHWAQNGNLNHYPTQYGHQLINPIWAELAILNLRLLWGNDQVADLIQWFSMVGSLVGVSLIASLLGARRKEQLLAVAFVVAIPMGILQSTSTQNDYVTAFWLVCMVYFMLLAKKRDLTSFEWLSLILAVGLGMLTKGTFYLYAFPFLLWFFLPRLLNIGWGRFVREGFVFTVIVAIINLGFWIRNLITYQGPLGPGDWFSRVIQIQTSPKMWFPAISKHVAINFVSTIPRVNELIFSLLERIHTLFNVEIGEFKMLWGWNHEDLAANPLHVLAVSFSLLALLMTWSRKDSRKALRYALVLLSSFILFVVLIKFNVFITRFHLPFFVLWGGVFGAAAHFSELKKLVYLASFLLLVSSIPWLLLNRSRNVIGYRPYTSLGDSAFHEPSEFVLLANWNALRQPLLGVTKAIKSTDCMEVGLKIDSHDIEYPYWWLLEAPQSGIRIEAIDPPAHLERYVDQDFSPCAIICSICDDLDRYRGLERIGDYGEGIVLFTGLNYSPDDDG